MADQQSAVFRVVYFVPDPCLEWQVPVAALYRGPDGNLHTVIAPHPGQGNIGGWKQARLLDHILAHLHEVTSFDDVVPAFGNYVYVGKEFRLPELAGDTKQFLLDLLPRPQMPVPAMYSAC